MSHATKISVQESDYNNNCFVCICFDPALGDSTPDRVITEEELMQHLGARSLDLIPTTVSHDNAEGEMVECERFVSFEDWGRDNDLDNVLSDIINAREDRTGRAAYNPKPLGAADFLPVGNLNNLLHQIAA